MAVPDPHDVERPRCFPSCARRVTGDLLALLYLHPEAECSLTEVASVTGASLNAVHYEARKLSEAGLIGTRKRGNLRLVRAVTDSLHSRPRVPSRRVARTLAGAFLVFRTEVFTYIPLGAYMILLLGVFARAARRWHADLLFHPAQASRTPNYSERRYEPYAPL